MELILNFYLYLQDTFPLRGRDVNPRKFQDRKAYFENNLSVFKWAHLFLSIKTPKQVFLSLTEPQTLNNYGMWSSRRATAGRTKHGAGASRSLPSQLASVRHSQGLKGQATPRAEDALQNCYHNPLPANSTKSCRENGRANKWNVTWTETITQS